MIVKAGSTNVSVYYYIVQDASATSPGEPVTGLLFSDIETGGSASYARQGAARVDLTLITLGSASASHSDGGFILVDDTNMPGLYRCDYPDAAFATGIDQVFCQIVIAGSNNAVAAPILIDIDDSADQTGDNFARLGAPAGASVSADNAAIKTGVDGIPTTAMRGTDGVDTATMRGTDSAFLAANAPTNFSSMVISGAGAVDSLLQGFLNSTIAETSVNRISNNFEFFYDNADAQTTQVVDDVGGGGGGGTDWTASERNEIRGRLGVTGTTSAGGNTPTLSTQSSVDAIPTTAMRGTDGVDTATMRGTDGANTTVPDAAGTAPTLAEMQTTALTESYAANGSEPTQNQLLYAVHQMLMEFAIAGTSYTVKRLDSSTTAFIVTLDDATNPTSNTR